MRHPYSRSRKENICEHLTALTEMEYLRMMPTIGCMLDVSNAALVAEHTRKARPITHQAKFSVRLLLSENRLRK